MKINGGSHLGAFGRLRLGVGALASVLLLLTLVRCGKDKNQIDCGPEDQRGSYMPKLEPETVRVVLDSNAASLAPAVERAVQVWNQASNGDLNRPLFSFDRSRVFRDQAYLGGGGGCDSIQGSSGAVIVSLDTSNPSESHSAWGQLGLTAANPAVTIRGSDSDQGVMKQVVLVNANALNSGQATSVILHELGHAIGLDHSCTDGSPRDDYAGCGGLGADHPYRQAVMYPRLAQTAHSGGEVKESLQTNDLERMQCLYSN